MTDNSGGDWIIRGVKGELYPCKAAFPIPFDPGLTKRELACILSGVPETGIEEVDAVIRKARRERIAARAMQGLCADPRVDDCFEGIAVMARKAADALIAELDKEKA